MKYSKEHDNHVDSKRERSIFTYSRYNTYEYIQSLLEDEEFDVNERDDYGRTALHICATFDSYECARILLSHPNIKIDFPDFESGWTPLHRALYFKSFRVALILIRAGAKLGDELCGDWRSSVISKRDHTRSMRNWYRWTSNVDHEGHTPLDLLSCSLVNELNYAKENLISTSVLTFGKADYILGVTLPNTSGDIYQPRRIECLESCALDSINQQSIVKISASKYHSTAVTKDGKCYSWGHGRSGRLGHGDENPRPEPELIRSLVSHIVKQVATSENHTLILTSTGKLYSWGSNRFGQLGHGFQKGDSTGGVSLLPQQVKGLGKHKVMGIAVGDTHSVCYTDDGEVYTWGSNKSGQLGLKPTEVSSMPGGGIGTGLPKKVTGIQSIIAATSQGIECPVIQVSAAYCSTLLLCRSAKSGQSRIVNEVYQWGYGQIGPVRIPFHPSSTNKSDITFETTTGSIEIVQLAAGRYHNVALASSGLVYTWGVGGSGADHLGHAVKDLTENSKQTFTTPQVVDVLLPENGGCRAVYVNVSSNRTCIISKYGDLYTWGSADHNGTLGHGNGKYQPVPKRVVGVKKAVAVACGEDHTLVLQAATLPLLPFQNLNILSPRPTESNPQLDTLATESDSEDVTPDNSSILLSPPFSIHDIRPSADEIDTQKESQYCSLLWKCPSLKDLCQRKLAEQVNLRTVLGILAIVKQLLSPELVTFCTAFINKNMDAILVEASVTEIENILDSFSDASGSIIPTSCKALRSDESRKLSTVDRDHTHEFKERDKKLMASNSSYGEDKRDSRSGSLSKRHETRSGSMGEKRDSSSVEADWGLFARRDRSQSKDLDSSVGVARLMRAVKKKLVSIEDIEHRISTGDIASLSNEMQDKLNRKISLQSELKRLELIHTRLVTEEKIVEQTKPKQNILQKTQPEVRSDTRPTNELNISNQEQPTSSSSSSSSSSEVLFHGRKLSPGIEITSGVPPQFDVWKTMVSGIPTPSSDLKVAQSPTPQSIKSSSSPWSNLNKVNRYTSSMNNLTPMKQVPSSSGLATRIPLSSVGSGGRTVLSPSSVPFISIEQSTPPSSSNRTLCPVSSSRPLPRTASEQTPKTQTTSAADGSAPSSGISLANFIITPSKGKIQHAKSSPESEVTPIHQNPKPAWSTPNVALNAVSSDGKNSSTASKGKSLRDIQAEDESRHNQLFVQGYCVLDKFESAWVVGVTKGEAGSIRDVMREQEEQDIKIRREEQMRREAEIAKQPQRDRKKKMRAFLKETKPACQATTAVNSTTAIEQTRNRK